MSEGVSLVQRTDQMETNDVPLGVPIQGMPIAATIQCYNCKQIFTANSMGVVACPHCSFANQVQPQLQPQPLMSQVAVPVASPVPMMNTIPIRTLPQEPYQPCWRKSLLPIATLCAIVAMICYLVALLASWLTGPVETYNDDNLFDSKATCYTIGLSGEDCFQSCPSSFYSNSLCCPPNIGCCNMANYQNGTTYETSYSQLLSPVSPIFWLSLITLVFIIYQWSSRCRCCRCGPCNINISNKNYSFPNIIQVLTIFLRFTTIVMSIVTLILFKSDKTIQLLTNYNYPTLPPVYPTAVVKDQSSIKQPGVVSICCALCFDAVAMLISCLDFYLLKKGS